MKFLSVSIGPDWYYIDIIAIDPGFWQNVLYIVASPGGSDGKKSACNVGNLSSIPGLGRSLGGGHGNPPIFFPGESSWTEEPGKP